MPVYRATASEACLISLDPTVHRRSEPPELVVSTQGKWTFNLQWSLRALDERKGTTSEIGRTLCLQNVYKVARQQSALAGKARYAQQNGNITAWHRSVMSESVVLKIYATLTPRATSSVRLAGRVAQWRERSFPKRKVRGSTPRSLDTSDFALAPVCHTTLRLLACSSCPNTYTQYLCAVVCTHSSQQVWNSGTAACGPHPVPDRRILSAATSSPCFLLAGPSSRT